MSATLQTPKHGFRAHADGAAPRPMATAEM